MHTRPVRAAVAALLLTSTMGCASVAGGGDASAPDILLDPDLAAAARSAVRADATPAARRMINDGVTLPEYRAAVVDAASCYERGVEQLAAGRGVSVNVDVGPVEVSADGYEASTSYRVDLGSVPSGMLDDAAIEAVRRIEAECAERQLATVERSYQIEHLADRDFASEVAADASKCLRAAGFSRAEAAPSDLQGSIRDRLAERDVPVDGEVADCLEDFPAVTDLPLVDPPEHP